MSGTDDFLEDYYDVVVLSTGLQTSILAAALAKSGRSVLHLDRNEYYGEDAASFSFTQLLDWAAYHAHDHRGTDSEDTRTISSFPTSSPGKSAAIDVSSRSSPTYDPAAVAVAIARAHARNDLRKERTAEEKPSSNGGNTTCGGDAHDPVASEAEDKCDGSLSSPELNCESDKANGPSSVAAKNDEGEAAVAQGEQTPVTSDDAPKSAGATAADANESGYAGRRSPSEEAETSGSTGPAAAGTTREDALSASAGTGVVGYGRIGIQDTKHDSAADVGAESSSSGSSQPNGYNRETSATTEILAKQKEEEAKKREQERNDEILIEREAALRLKSLDLDLIPLSYHGCCTKVGQPSDTCIQERADRKAIEEAAAAAGRYARPHGPSHPAWVGRTAHKARTGGGADGGAGAGAEEVLHPTFWGFKTDREPGAADLVRLSRSFNLDLTSQVLLATGPAVDTLVTSGVASYLEFKDMQALYLGADQQPGGEKRRPSARNGDDGGEELTAAGISQTNPKQAKSHTESTGGDMRNGMLGLSRVPCSKADIFSTKLLSPLDKRRLMKFLLFASDWGLQRAGEDVLSRNEAGLGRGRSLRRPQNREAASSDFDYDAYADKPFREFLESCGLPERVRAMITHALALLPGNSDGDDVARGIGGEERGREGGSAEPTTLAGLEAVYRHLSALGRFGETAFIAPLYGVGELPQAFCRMAAVYGAVYVLRRELMGAVVDRATGRCVGVVDDSGRAFACGALVVGGEYFSALPPPTPSTITPPTSNGGSLSTKGLSANNGLAPNGAKNVSETVIAQPPPAASSPVVARSEPPAPPGAKPSLTRQQQDMARHAQQHINHRQYMEEQARKNLEYAKQQQQNWLDKQQQHQQQQTKDSTTKPLRESRRLLRRVVVASGPVVTPTAGVSTTGGTTPSPAGTTTGGIPTGDGPPTTAASDPAGGERKGRGVCVLPPGLLSVGNTAAIHAISVDASTVACPEALVADGGACVLHLTTTVGVCGATATGLRSEDEHQEEDGEDGVLGRAAKALLMAAGVQEIWSLGFSWDIQEPVAEESLPPNMVVCERPAQELYVHDVIVKAERCFSRLCPGEPFWPPPKTDEEEDDQAEMLKAVASAVTDTLE